MTTVIPLFSSSACGIGLSLNNHKEQAYNDPIPNWMHPIVMGNEDDKYETSKSFCCDAASMTFSRTSSSAHLLVILYRIFNANHKANKQMTRKLLRRTSIGILVLAESRGFIFASSRHRYYDLCSSQNAKKHKPKTEVVLPYVLPHGVLLHGTNTQPRK